MIAKPFAINTYIELASSGKEMTTARKITFSMARRSPGIGLIFQSGEFPQGGSAWIVDTMMEIISRTAIKFSSTRSAVNSGWDGIERSTFARTAAMLAQPRSTNRSLVTSCN